MSSRIREGTRADVPALLDLWEALAVRGSEADPRWRVVDDARAVMDGHMREDWFGRFLPFPPVWVAEVDGSLVGFVAGTPASPPPVIHRPPTARIGDLFVRPEHRRQGLARQLVEAFCAGARRSGYAHLEVGTLTRDARAVAFWQALGFGDWMVLLRRDPAQP